MATLLVENLCFKYPGRPIFKDLSFSVSSSEFMHLKGSNGVGKTTLLAILAGYLEAQSGHCYVQLNADETTDQPTEYIASEYNAHFLKMPALENLSFYNKMGANVPTSALDDALDYWGLSNEYIKNYLPVEKFSTGMKRRLCLARLNISKSPIWILDEPILGIDKDGSRKFIEVCRSHIKNGGSIIMISHDTSGFEDIITNTLDFDKITNNREDK